VNTRAFAWNVSAGIMYALVLVIVVTVLDLIAKLFYPPFPVVIAPLLLFPSNWVLGLVEIVGLGLMVVFASPITVKSLNRELGQVRNISIFGVVGYLILSLLPYAVHSPYVQTFIGLTIVFILFDGLFAGYIATVLSPDEGREVNEASQRRR